MVIAGAQHQACQIFTGALCRRQGNKRAHTVTAKHAGQTRVGFTGHGDHRNGILYQAVPAVVVAEMPFRAGLADTQAMAAMIRTIQMPALFVQHFCQRLITGTMLRHAVQPDHYTFGGCGLGGPVVDSGGMAVACVQVAHLLAHNILLRRGQWTGWCL